MPASLLQSFDFGDEISEDDRRRYNRELEEFFMRYEQWFPQFEDALDARRLCRPLLLQLSNHGTLPADDVKLKLHLPDGFEVRKVRPRLPKRPRLPDLPLTLGQRAAENLLSLARNVPHLGGPNFGNPVVAPRQGLVSIKRTNSYDASFEWLRIMHHTKVSVGPLFILFDRADLVKSFTIDYTALAANAPYPLTGQIDVRCDCPSR